MWGWSSDFFLLGAGDATANDVQYPQVDNWLRDVQILPGTAHDFSGPAKGEVQFRLDLGSLLNEVLPADQQEGGCLYQFSWPESARRKYELTQRTTACRIVTIRSEGLLCQMRMRMFRCPGKIQG
jgi:hypothetical protein